jgi:hypothetical protein
LGFYWPEEGGDSFMDGYAPAPAAAPPAQGKAGASLGAASVAAWGAAAAAASAAGGPEGGDLDDEEDPFFFSAATVAVDPLLAAAAPVALPAAAASTGSTGGSGGVFGAMEAALQRRARARARYASMRTRRSLHELKGVHADQLALSASDFATTLGWTLLSAAFPSWVDKATGESVRVAVQSALFNATAAKTMAGQEAGAKEAKGTASEGKRFPQGAAAESAAAPPPALPSASTLGTFLLRNALMPAAAHRAVAVVVNDLVTDAESAANAAGNACRHTHALESLGALGHALAHVLPGC